jgi:uroporphyrinogen decarboxylase
MDPAILRAPPRAIVDEATSIVEAYGANPGHVFNLGHGITPDIDPENVAVLVDTVHECSARLFAST